MIDGSILKILNDNGFPYLMKGMLKGKVVLTNGCFDILHRGHVECLEYASTLGDSMIVAINDDDGIRALKGEGRPVNKLEDRMFVLASLRCVDMVIAFHGTKATNLFRLLTPDVYVKGGDYTIDTLDKGEREALLAGNPFLQFEFFQFQTQISTTSIISKMAFNTK